MRELAVARQKSDLERLDGNGFHFDEAAAEDVITFIETFCHHYKGKWAGKRLKLQGWQKYEVIYPLFGWKRADGTRRFREAYVEIPRKNGKTILAAAIGLYLFMADGEQGCEVYCAATKKEQARLLWDDAVSMVEMSPALDARVDKYRRSQLSRSATRSKFCYVGANSKTMDGLNAHGVLLDEMHEHRDAGVYTKLTKAMGAREQPLTFIITTAGVYNPESIGWQKHDYARKVLNGDHQDEAFFAYIAAADKDADPFDPETWRQANPNYGISKYPAYMEIEAAKAKSQPTLYNEFLRFELNIWTQSQDRWLDADRWKACGTWQADPVELEGEVCYGAIDMSTSVDLTAFVLVFPETWKVLAWMWCPEERILERSRQDGAPYDMWSQSGILQATPGSAVDYHAVRNDIVDIASRYPVQEVWYDPWNAHQIAQELAEDHGIHTVQCRQGYASMNGPSRLFERLLYSGELQHGDNPALNWMASHIAKKEDPAGNIKPDKSASSERIDGIVALIMACGAAGMAEKGMSDLYDDDDPIVVEFG